MELSGQEPGSTLEAPRPVHDTTILRPDSIQMLDLPQTTTAIASHSLASTCRKLRLTCVDGALLGCQPLGGVERGRQPSKQGLGFLLAALAAPCTPSQRGPLGSSQAQVELWRVGVSVYGVDVCRCGARRWVCKSGRGVWVCSVVRKTSAIVDSAGPNCLQAWPSWLP